MYWVVRFSPKDPLQGDAERFIGPASSETRWRTNKPPKDWRAGDRIFFWESSPAKRLVALGSLVSTNRGVSSDGERVYEVRYLTPVMPHPVPLDDLRKDPIAGTASFLKRGPAQSVLRLRVEEAERMYRMLNERNDRKAACWPDIWLGPPLAPPATSEA